MNLLNVASEATYVRVRAENTLRRVRQQLARWAAFGVASTEDCTPERIAMFMQMRIQEVSPNSANLELLSLLSVLTHLEKSGRYDFHALRALRRQRVEAPNRKALTAPHLTVEEFNRLIQSAATVRWPWEAKCSPQEAVLAARLVTYSGMRQQEAARLRWEDIDWQSKTLAVRNTEDGSIKTGNERRVPICPPLYEALRNTPQIGPYVLGVGKGRLRKTVRALSSRAMQDRIAPLRKAAGMPHVTFVLLRHSRASWWIQAGVPPAKVASWLGHSLDVCMRHYVGIRPEYDPDCEKMPA